MVSVLTGCNKSESYLQTENKLDVKKENTSKILDAQVSKKIKLEVMIGEEYAAFCNYMSPKDNENFNYDDKNSWRFIFVRSIDGVAQIKVNKELLQLNITSSNKTNNKDAFKEVYKSQHNPELSVVLEVSLQKNSYESNVHVGTLVLKNGLSVRQASIVGECGS